jgi:hypothetical protein
MGYHGAGLVDTDVDRLILGARAKVRRYYSESMFADKEIRFDVDTELQIREDWMRVDIPTRAAVIKDLQARWDKSGHPSADRGELEWFLRAVRAISAEGRIDNA